MTDPYIPIRPIRRRPTDEDLDQEATITNQDVVDAVAAFKRHTSEESRDLLRGHPDDDPRE